jgi:ribosomal protein L37AE/L43A
MKFWATPFTTQKINSFKNRLNTLIITKMASRIGYGIKLKKKAREVEVKQRKKQSCPFCTKKGVKRLAKGLWKCKRCGKKFASHTYYLE